MNDFIRVTQSRIGGATRKIAEMAGWLVKMGLHVAESNQSNVAPWQFDRGSFTEPEREANRVVCPLAERRGAMREDTFPVPPRRRIVPLVVFILLL